MELAAWCERCDWTPRGMTPPEFPNGLSWPGRPGSPLGAWPDKNPKLPYGEAAMACWPCPWS